MKEEYSSLFEGVGGDEFSVNSVLDGFSLFKSDVDLNADLVEKWESASGEQGEVLDKRRDAIREAMDRSTDEKKKQAFALWNRVVLLKKDIDKNIVPTMSLETDVARLDIVREVLMEGETLVSNDDGSYSVVLDEAISTTSSAGEKRDFMGVSLRLINTGLIEQSSLSNSEFHKVTFRLKSSS